MLNQRYILLNCLSAGGEDSEAIYSVKDSKNNRSKLPVPLIAKI